MSLQKLREVIQSYHTAVQACTGTGKIQLIDTGALLQLVNEAIAEGETERGKRDRSEFESIIPEKETKRVRFEVPDDDSDTETTVEYGRRVCGDSGGRTRSGRPCRAYQYLNEAGRCYHHDGGVRITDYDDWDSDHEDDDDWLVEDEDWEESEGESGSEEEEYECVRA